MRSLRLCRVVPASLFISAVTSSFAVAVEPGRLISGDAPLARLFEGVTMADYPKITQPDLKRDIEKRQLAAIYLPNPEVVTEADKYVAWRCRKDTTELQNVTLAAEEYQLLYKWAINDQIGNAAAEAATADNPAESLQALTRHIEQLPLDRRKSAQLYAGMIMSAARKPELVDNPLVAGYREHQTKAAIAKVEAFSNAPALTGVLLTYGGLPVSKQELESLTPEDVATKTIKGTDYKFAWVGPRLVVVPQPKTGTSPIWPHFQKEKNPLNAIFFPAAEETEVYTNLIPKPETQFEFRN